MNEETPWGRFPDREQHPAFGKAYRRLTPEQKAAADVAIAEAADRMHALLGHPLLETLAWPGLPRETARLVDMAERTCLAMGVFRLAIAGRLGSQRTMLSDGLDLAADDVDQRAVRLALHALSAGYPLLEKVRVQESAAYHRLLSGISQAYPGLGFAVAQVQSDPAAALDMTLETGLQHGMFGSVVAHQKKIRRDVQKATEEVVGSGSLPREAAVALWLLAIMGLGRVFGEDDKTLAYAD
ncbi:MAG: hypothetical protein H6734_09760 [Alphaproteobacteria bacterium]|nr:hypothetical protein [Alphaproteobacteria bacterium]